MLKENDAIGQGHRAEEKEKTDSSKKNLFSEANIKRNPEAFFAEFGEPSQINLDIIDRYNKFLVLEYAQYGSKKLDLHDAIKMDYWDKSILDWKIEDDHSIIKVMAEVGINGVSGATEWKTIAYCSDSDAPYLEKEFDLLPASEQENIISRFRERVVAPEITAEKEFNEFLSKDYNRDKLEKEKKDIIALQAPGEVEIGSDINHVQREIVGRYGGDSWGTGSNSKEKVIYYYLLTGIKDGNYTPGGRFIIKEPTTEQTPEIIRDRLLAQKRQSLLDFFENHKKIDLPNFDSRIYDINKDEWLDGYNRKWKEMADQEKAKWEIEEREALTRMQEKIDILPTQEIKLNDSVSYDTVSDLSGVKNEMEDEINKSVEVEQFDVPEGLLGKARSLAEEAVEKLGFVGAQELFQSTASADYGRTRRQQVIKGILGQSSSLDVNSFYNSTSADVVNTILDTAIKIIERTSASNKKIDKLLSESPMEDLSLSLKMETDKLPQLNLIDGKNWLHQPEHDSKHSGRLSKAEKAAYNNGERINVRCSLCVNNPLVGYLQK